MLGFFFPFRSPNVFRRLSPRWIRDICGGVGGAFHLARQTHAGGRDYWRTRSSEVLLQFDQIAARAALKVRVGAISQRESNSSAVVSRAQHTRTHARHKSAPQFPDKAAKRTRQR